MKLNVNSLFILVILFLIFPFFYFFQLHSLQVFFLSTPAAVYPVIIVSGLLLAFCVDNSPLKKMLRETKNFIFISAATLVVLYAILLFILTIVRFKSLISQAVDVNYFNQVIWQLSEFKIPYLWSLDKSVFSAWSQHFSPILIFLAPVYWVIPNDIMLMVIQALAALTGAIPVYLIGKRFLKSRSIGLVLSFAYLSFGGLQYGFDYGFHEILFFPVLFLWSYYFYLKKNTRLYLLFIILSLFVKEEASFIVIFWAIYLFAVKRDWKPAIMTCVLGIIWYIVCFDIVFPYFNKGNGFGYWGQYATQGGSGIIGIVLATLTKPLQFFQTLVTPADKIDMMFETFGQFAFLFLLFPPSIIIIFPSLMEKLLSTGIAMANGAHYSAAITAVVVVATLEAIPRIYHYRFVDSLVHNKNIFFSVLIFYMAYSSAIFYGYIGFSPMLLFEHNVYEQGLTPDNSLLLSKIIESLPRNATVGAQAQVAAQIPIYYKDLSLWPAGLEGDEDFIIIDTQVLPVGASGAQYNTYLNDFIKKKNYKMIVDEAGIYVFENKSYR
jgi:uncharacterized membrane protein